MLLCRTRPEELPRARDLATRLRAAHGFSLRGMPVCLGRLESVDFAAVTAIVIIALGLMIRVIELLSALRRIGATLGCMVILIMLPPIIMNLWHSLSLWQQFGIIVFSAVLGTVVLRRSSSRRRKRDHPF